VKTMTGRGKGSKVAVLGVEDCILGSYGFLGQNRTHSILKGLDMGYSSKINETNL
jgi:hypothetical protein